MLYNIIGNVPASLATFTSTPAYGFARLDWTYGVPEDMYLTELWEGETNSIGSASLIKTVYKTNFYIVILNPGEDKYYWARVATDCGKYSAFSGPLYVQALVIIFLSPSFSTQTATSTSGAITQTRSKNLAVTFTSTPGFARKEVDKLTGAVTFTSTPASTFKEKDRITGAVTFTSTPAATFLYSVNTTSTLLWDIQ